MNARRELHLIRLGLAGLLLLLLGIMLPFAVSAYQEGTLFSSRRALSFLAIISLAVILDIAGLITAWLMPAETILERTKKIYKYLQRYRKLNYAFFVLLAMVYPFALQGILGEFLESIWQRLALYCILGALGFLTLSAGNEKAPWWESLSLSLLGIAAFHRIALYIPDISDNPFSLSWSEASRYYYASLFFSEHIYGIATPPTVLHPSRYLLQAIPFLASGASIIVHRAWQVVLWIVITGLSAAALARRLQLPSSYLRLALICWSFLFLFVGPVYYHLQIPALLVLWLYDRNKPWQTAAAIGAASIWAGISRVNWFPVPGMLAALLYFLEEPRARLPYWRYLLQPAIWTIAGTGLAFLSQATYAVLSGNPTNQFTSSFTSDLLWYRLLPNPTYPAGILLSSILVSLPPLLLIGGKLCSANRSYHWIRLAGSGAILLVFFGGGLVVSTKIGGGSNLHNLDAYLALLMVLVAYVVADRAVPEPPAPDPEKMVAERWPKVLVTLGVLLTIFYPVVTTVVQGAPLNTYERQEVQDGLIRLSRFVKEASEEGGEILFISQRQLLTFQVITGVRLVPEYEKVFLMEMAMANDSQYLEKFWRELEHHRFALIVTEPLFTRLKGAAQPFGEENDAWVKNVSEKILCYYDLDKRLRAVSLQTYVPRKEAMGCPAPALEMEEPEFEINPED